MFDLLVICTFEKTEYNICGCTIYLHFILKDHWISIKSTMTSSALD